VVYEWPSHFGKKVTGWRKWDRAEVRNSESRNLTKKERELDEEDGGSDREGKRPCS